MRYPKPPFPTGTCSRDQVVRSRLKQGIQLVLDEVALGADINVGQVEAA